MLYYCLTDFRLVMFIILLFLWKRKMVTYSVWVTRLYSNSNLQATVHFPNLNFKTLQFLGRGIEPWLFQKLTRAKQSWRMLSRHRMWWVMHINQSIPQVTFTCTSHIMQHNESLPERAAPWDSVWRGVGWGKEIKKYWSLWFGKLPLNILTKLVVWVAILLREADIMYQQTHHHCCDIKHQSEIWADYNLNLHSRTSFSWYNQVTCASHVLPLIVCLKY